MGSTTSLTLHGPHSGDPDDTRLIGFDNAHAVRGRRPRRTAKDTGSQASAAHDYTDAASLLADFWKAVEGLLAERG